MNPNLFTETSDGKYISPFHDIPLYADEAKVCKFCFTKGSGRKCRLYCDKHNTNNQNSEKRTINKDNGCTAKTDRLCTHL